MLVISLNQIIFFFSLVELLIGIIFIVPLPKGWKQRILCFVEESKTVKKCLQYHNFLICAVGLHWAYSIKISADLNEQHNIEKQSNFNAVTSRDLQILERKFSAESDIYLNGTFLFVSIFINRLIALLQYYYQIKHVNELELKVDLSKSLDEIKAQISSKSAQVETATPAQKEPISKKQD